MSMAENAESEGEFCRSKPSQAVSLGKTDSEEKLKGLYLRLFRVAKTRSAGERSQRVQFQQGQ